MDLIAFFAIFISLLLIGFFAGIEIAFVSANKLSIELRKKQGTYAGKIWGVYADNPARFIGNTLVGINIVLVLYGLLWSNFMKAVWKNHIGEFYWNIENPYLHLLFETAVSTFFLLLFEFIFKAYFRAKNDRILSSDVLTYMVQTCYNSLSWMSQFFVDTAEWILRHLFNVKLNVKKEVFTKVDLEHFIQQSKNHDEEDSTEINKELFENALSLSETRIRECLVPRKEIEAVTIQTSIEELRQKFIQTKLSKLIVYENDIDNIVGYVHQLDLFKNPAQISNVLLPIAAIPESMSATDLMNKFSRERKSIAWVIDEFGGTAGIVTMEDLLEEIFGEIKDEYDTEELVEKQIAANEFIFSGRMELDAITEKYNIEFPDSEDTETLSGFIIHSRDGIPKEKETFTSGNFQFTILSVGDTRIETVKVKLLK